MNKHNNNLQQKLSGKRVILASASARRQLLLKEMGIVFETDTNLNIDETTLRIRENYSESKRQIYRIPQFLAKSKSLAFHRELKDNEILITADTLVFQDHSPIGKPQNAEDAIKMLRQLSGVSHNVITGVCLRDCHHTVIFSQNTKVEFYPLSDSDIEWYIKQFSPLDKAGSYGIQEWIGMIGVKKIVGSFYNIMGLPTEKLYSKLLEF